VRLPKLRFNKHDKSKIEASLREISVARAKAYDEAISSLQTAKQRKDRLPRHETLLAQVSYLAMTTRINFHSKMVKTIPLKHQFL